MVKLLQIFLSGSREKLRSQKNNYLKRQRLTVKRWFLRLFYLFFFILLRLFFLESYNAAEIIIEDW